MRHGSYDCEWDAFYKATLEGDDVRKEKYVDGGTVWRSALGGSGKERLSTGLTDPQYVAAARAKAIAAPVPDTYRKLPTQVTLHRNYPNPFNPSARIDNALLRAMEFRLTAFDVLGRRVRTLVDRRPGPGRREVGFDGTGHPSGLYLYQLRAESVSIGKTMRLMK